MALITMTFEPGKPTELKVTGAKGKKCKELSKPFVDLLGDASKTLSDTPTAEMNQQETSAVRQQISR